MAKPRVPKAKRVVSETIDRDRRIKKRRDAMWKAAKKAPMMGKRIAGANGEKTRFRLARLISSHAHNVMLQGAQNERVARQAWECKVLGIPFSNDVDPMKRENAEVEDGDDSLKGAGGQMSMSRAAMMMEEQFLAALINDIQLRALLAHKALNNGKRIKEYVLQYACDVVKAQYFGRGLGAPEKVIIVPLRTRKHKSRAAAPTSEEGAEAISADA